MAKKVLVTGAAGRIGRELVKALLARGYSVVAVVLRKGEATKLFGKKVEEVACDLSSEESTGLLEGACAGVFCVVHLAANTDYSASEERMIKDNAGGTRNVLHAARKAGVKRFVHASSTSVFRKPAKLPIDEKQPYSPVNAYGRSKVAAEVLVKQAGIPFIILRPAVTYGPQFLDFFAKFIQLVAEGRAKIIGSGANRIAFLHVRDAVAAFVKAVESKRLDEDYLIAADEELTQGKAYEIVARELGVAPPTKRVSLAAAKLLVQLDVFFKKLFGGRPKMFLENLGTIAGNRYYDVGKAKKLLGWKPRVSFRQGAKEMVAAWRKQQNKGF